MRVLRAAWWALLAERRLWRAHRLLRDRPRGHLLEAAAHAGEPVAAVSAPELAEARRIGAAVERAAALGALRPACLVRSMALATWLRDRGIPGVRLRLGTRMQEGRFEAHAWVEVGGVVVADRDAHVASFAPLTDALVDDR